MYCWDGGNPCRTTRSNLALHLEDIPFPALTPTLQDVVRLTRMLDFRYLWIDEVCIIQDGREDWFREASRMKAVYGRAFLTTSTDMLADTKQHFLSRGQ